MKKILNTRTKVAAIVAASSAICSAFGYQFLTPAQQETIVGFGVLLLSFF